MAHSVYTDASADLLRYLCQKDSRGILIPVWTAVLERTKLTSIGRRDQQGPARQQGKLEPCSAPNKGACRAGELPLQSASVNMLTSQMLPY